MDILKQLEDARKRLLDLTRRNRLLNHKPRKARSIRIVDEIPQEIYGRLVLNEKPMDFLPSESPEEADEGSNGDFVDDADEMLLWELPVESDGDVGRYTDRHLQTSLEKHHLQKRLFTIDKEARSILEEQGYTAMFLALGFLEWGDGEQSDRTNRAPLILIPVELSRTEVKAAFRVSWTGEDILTNLSLKEKLAEQHVSLPDFVMPDKKAGITSYFDAVTEAIEDKSDWRVLPDIWLDFFSFTKFVMYKDLDPLAWPEGRSPADHPLLEKLLRPEDRDDASFSEAFSEDVLDERLLPSEIYHVMDADPSQIAVIEAIKAGENLAVEGPPGTGKSQTITNAIAELLAAGKKVLFVSEKMAALEVVKERLDRVGLGDFCLELHSRKTKRKALLEELRSSLSSRQTPKIDMGHDFARLRQLKSDLNEYARALRTPSNTMGITPFELFEWKEQLAHHLDRSGRQLDVITFDNPETYTKDDVEVARSRLIELGQGLTQIGSPEGSPWRGCCPGTILPADESVIRGLIDECLAALEKVRAVHNKLASLTGVSLAQACGDHVPAILEAADAVGDSPRVNQQTLRVALTHPWKAHEKEINPLLELLASYQELRDRLTPVLVTEAFAREDLPDMLTEFKQRAASLLCWLSPRYRYLKREFRSWFREDPPKRPVELIKTMSDLARYREQEEQLAAGDALGKSLFADQWIGRESDVAALRRVSQWVPRFRDLARAKRVNERVIAIVSAGVDRGTVKQAIDAVNGCVAEMGVKLDELEARLVISWPEVFGAKRGAVSWDALTECLVAWRENISSLQSWAQYIARSQKCLECIARPVAEQAHAGLLGQEDLLVVFQGALADSLLHVVFSQSPVLAEFVGDIHQQKITEFTKLDQKIIEDNRKRLSHELYARRPHLRAGSPSDSAAGILHGQLNRKRGHMPIRKLLSTTKDIVQDLKPCFMMSPLSVAQFLDPRAVRFDVILFDEASQVRPEDALGTLLRGDQVAVFGDTRQLPPTSFFDVLVNDEEEDGAVQTGIGQVESILHQCRIAFPKSEMNWHYRSRDESLIAVANQEFYENRLRVYPSASKDDDWLGLKFQYVPGTIYDRGKSSINREEAKVVARAVMEHFEQHPDKSLGVGAFSASQQQAIWDEVELLLRARPDLEEFFKSDRDEHFFVKNLETIQGDERDVILISIGYGFDADGRLKNIFGPINNDGGERRLNVLITRARERSVVFANFHAGDLQVQATSSHGPRALKTFLEYAENRNLRSLAVDCDDTDSPFEDSVIDFLQSSGYEITKQVGCAGFRVDIGIVHPDSPGRYLVGVECDGAKYHSSCVARDRDRLRQQVLEGLGWRIVRVWSTDWYRHRRETQRRLLATIDDIRRDHRIEMPSTANRASTLRVPLSAGRETEIDDPADAESRDWSSPPLETVIEEYKMCSSLSVSTAEPLLDTPWDQLIEAVTEVVSVEGPVCVEEVVRRVRTCWGLKRTGNRIEKRIRLAIDFAAQEKTILLRHGFCWNPLRLNVLPRRRNGDVPVDLKYICGEEIMAAVSTVLEDGYGIAREGLINKTCRALGFKRVSAETADGIWPHIAAMLDSGQLTVDTNDKIILKN